MDAIEIKKIISENKGFPLRITRSDGTVFYGYPRRLKTDYDCGKAHPKKFRLLLQGELEYELFDDPSQVQDIRVLK